MWILRSKGRAMLGSGYFNLMNALLRDRARRLRHPALEGAAAPSVEQALQLSACRATDVHARSS